MGSVKDLTGQRFGRLTVIERVKDCEGAKGHNILWLCACDCGKQKIVTSNRLRVGNTRSCGCLVGKGRKTHGMSNTRIYYIWSMIKMRCYKKDYGSYETRGGRGVGVCEQWRNDFEAFYKWAMEHGYADDLSLARKDADADYSPENCYWASITDERDFKMRWRLTLNGETKPITKWCEEFGVTKSMVVHRIQKLGWDVEKALTTPSKKAPNLVTLNGETKTLQEWCDELGISRVAVWRRMNKKGWDVEKALTTPVQKKQNKAKESK